MLFLQNQMSNTSALHVQSCPLYGQSRHFEFILFTGLLYSSLFSHIATRSSVVNIDAFLECAVTVFHVILKWIRYYSLLVLTSLLEVSYFMKYKQSYMDLLHVFSAFFPRRKHEKLHKGEVHDLGPVIFCIFKHATHFHCVCWFDSILHVVLAW